MQRRLAQAAGMNAWAIATALAAYFSFVPEPAQARNDPSAMCDRAAVQIADETEVPLDVLRAITRAETGRGADEEMRPWPWTVNMEGQGVWFDNEAQAQSYVFRHFRTGARSFDIGCFQISYKWHGHAFSSIEEMFDPVLNARYAARFLTKLFSEHGDWARAVGAYHSRTQKHAARYLKKYQEVRPSLPQTSESSTKSASALKGKGFPLLSGQSSQGRAGSLMPQRRGPAGSLFAPQQGG